VEFLIDVFDRFSSYIAYLSMKPTRIHVFLLSIGLLFAAVCEAQAKLNERVTPSLKNILINKKSNQTVDVFISARDLSFLENDSDVQIISEYKGTNTALIKISVDKLSSLLNKKEIVFADSYRTPKEEVTTGSMDISLNKINLEHDQFKTINGDSINVSLKEQRFDTTDIDIRGRIFESGLASNLQSSHASIMATILAGAGNTSPFATGAARGANLTSSDYATLLPDADNVYRQYKISIQNHSYGTGIENYYGADAASYDMSSWQNPIFLHVFSSGNSGTGSSTSGAYTGIAGYANLTGSFKMAKNIITVGATDSFNVVAALSSKGPAFDGRVKPELVAFGEDGSSGAAALTSGAGALVQQAYLDSHNNLPRAALVKAVLLNSADDIGEKHVDFSSGYGSLNAFAAVNTIKENRFLEGAVVQGQTKIFPIKIPAGIAQVKITLAWTDTAATPNAAKALVNDIDAVLQLPATNETWLPWVLSSFPDKDSLLLPAVRKVDTLNTVEQITVDDPQAGNYLLQIRAAKVQTSAQAFAIAYQFDTSNTFRWTYPNSTDVLTASKENIVRWQTNISSTATLEYSTDGTQWQIISSTVNPGTQYFKWNTPDTISTAFLRMNFPSLASVVSSEFIVSKPTGISVGFDCPDSFLLYWNKASSSNYQLYRLGPKYLETLQTVNDTFIVFQKKQHPNLFYSVAPLIDNKPGLRSFAVNYTTQGVGCYLKTFYALLQNGSTALLTTELGTLYNVADITFQKLGSLGFQNLKTTSKPFTTSATYSDLQLTQGANVYRLQVKLNDGSIIYSSTDMVFYFPGNPVLIYPNPVKQNQSVNIIAQDPGIYSINIYDLNGHLVFRQPLNNIIQQIWAMRLPAGLYVVKFSGEDGKTFTQKLVVY
jgi:hypothetical protein